MSDFHNPVSNTVCASILFIPFSQQLSRDCSTVGCARGGGGGALRATKNSHHYYCTTGQITYALRGEERTAQSLCNEAVGVFFNSRDSAGCVLRIQFKENHVFKMFLWH